MQLGALQTTDVVFLAENGEGRLDGVPGGRWLTCTIGRVVVGRRLAEV